ncbi:Protein of unknown function [Pseudomonas sp. NFPP33]|nr:DUF4435 domain-containing protein [Pseudomonas sp. NFPP33]SDA80863.1 Protein of unknown function [Pseudomonas sp. NFPP33]
MELRYDIDTYLTSVKMSAKIRVLVEGFDDQSHLLNILPKLCTDKKIKIDTAAEIKGDCPITAKNNRAKVEKLHQLSNGNNQYKKIFFLCDRETRGFELSERLQNLISGHHVDGSLSWTLGHSIENYFLSNELICEGFRYLTSSAYKQQAISLFSDLYESSTRLIACLTLAAQNLNSASLPCGLIQWKTLKTPTTGPVSIDHKKINNPRAKALIQEIEKISPAITLSKIDDCRLICRGHTAIILYQRIFAACLAQCAIIDLDNQPERDANIFNALDERQITSALSEAWIRKIESGDTCYPEPLINSILSA